eukprot:365534-Chlamydomonas_euryale.AAC.7
MELAKWGRLQFRQEFEQGAATAIAPCTRGGLPPCPWSPGPGAWQVRWPSAESKELHAFFLGTLCIGNSIPGPLA